MAVAVRGGKAYNIIMGKWPLLVLCSAACSTLPTDRPAKPTLSPALATTAGGTWVTIRGIPFALKTPRVELGLRSATGRDAGEWLSAEGVKKMDVSTLEFQTPRFIEDCADVRITDGDRTCLMPNVICFRTLAFTANQGTHDSSVLDTYVNAQFSPNPALSMPSATVPVSLAYSKVYPPARALYALDATSGNMECYDASNFVPLDIDSGLSGVQNVLVLQDSSHPPTTSARGAFDVDMNWSQGFVSHVTAGTDSGTNPTPGQLSWFGLDGNVPILLDVDDDAQTTSYGAPDGITRVKLCGGDDTPHCEQGYNSYFYPLTVKYVNLAMDVPDYEFSDGEPYPGGYAFVSGVGYKEGSAERQAMVAVLDLNTTLYCDSILHGWRYCAQLSIYDCSQQGPYCNERYWRRLQNIQGRSANYKTLSPANCTDDPAVLGDTKLAMDFVNLSGSPSNGPTLYLANQHLSNLYLFNYDQQERDWCTVMNGSNPFTIATGNNPTGVKVQKVTLNTIPPQEVTYAYITNADDDTVLVIDTADNSYEELIDYTDSNCFIAGDGEGHIHRGAMAIDTRSKGGNGEFAYTADFLSNSSSIINLPAGECSNPIDDTEGMGDAPADIVVQPVPDGEEIFGQMLGMMLFSGPADYSAAEDQPDMIADWKALHHLVKDNGSVQAVITAIDNFLRKADQNVKKDMLKKNLKEGVKLYRVAYLHDHPGN